MTAINKFDIQIMEIHYAILFSVHSVCPIIRASNYNDNVISMAIKYMLYRKEPLKVGM